MIKHILAFMLLGLLLLVACASPGASQPVREVENPLDITVFRAPT